MYLQIHADAHGGQKKVSNTLELEVQPLSCASHVWGARNGVRVFCNNSKGF